MKRLLPLLVGLVVAAVCARLGLWQLDRLEQRRARNAEITARAAMPVLRLPGDLAPGAAADAAFRPAAASGVFDFDRQIIEMARPRDGVPGVWVLTPLRLGDGSSVLVVRGWVYSPDARTVETERLSEPESATVHGVLLRPGGDPRSVQPDTLDGDVLPLVLRRTQLPRGAPEGMVALAAPAVDDGPHLAYAVQWFIFGTIAAVGGVLLYRRERAAAADGPAAAA